MYLKEGSKRSLRDGQMWLNGIIKRCKDDFGDKKEHIILIEYEQKINAALEITS